MPDYAKRKRAVAAQLRLQRKKMALVRSYKGSCSCRVCGETDPVVLELHHCTPGTKNPKLAQRRYGKAMQRTGGDGWRRLSFEEIAMELEKCEVLCANCHRRETHRQRLEGSIGNQTEAADESALSLF